MSSTSSNAWPAGNDDGSSEPSQTGHEEHTDRKMIQHLLGRYGPEELSRLIHNELGPQSDGASVVSSVAPSSVLSDDASSIWDNQSVRTFSSDGSSITGSIRSNVSRGAKFFSRLSSSGSGNNSSSSTTTTTTTSAAANEDLDRGSDVTPQSTPARDSASVASSGASKQKGSFKCGFCKEGDIVKTCTRKNDLKRHIEDFHNVSAQWHCRHRGCQMVFDWQAAYKTHLKTAHGGSRMSLDDAKVTLCPQVVFGCGFDNCGKVFEALDDADSASVFKEYVSHVVKHFDEGINSGEWSYSARMRALLRQGQVAPYWNEVPDASLQWAPQTSNLLRKKLETRHVGDVKLLVRYAHTLGSDPNTPVKFREDFVSPVSNSCMLVSPGHKGRGQQQQQAQAMPPQAPQFRISRGANPELAQYLASQRKVYVPSRQRSVRAPQLHQVGSTANFMGASQQPQTSPHHQPRQHQGRGNLGHFFADMPDGNMAPSRMYHHDPNAGQPHYNGGMHQGGVIADDIQNLRGMTNGSPEPRDVDMQDPSAMMDFASPYPAYGLQSPAPTMEGHHGFQ